MSYDDYNATCNSGQYQSKNCGDIAEHIHDYSEALSDTYNATYNVDVQSSIYLKSSTTSNYHEFI